MAQCIRCQVTLNPEADSSERYVNTWHIVTKGVTTPVTAANDFKAALQTFYGAIDQLMSHSINGVVPQFRAYNLLEVKPRQPIVDTSMTALTTHATTSLPPELAICLSYKADYQSGVTPRRRRGRIYLGPWSDSMLNSVTGRVDATALATIRGAVQTLNTAQAGSSTYGWVVYSPTTDTSGTGESGFYDVTEGWLDNAWDIQRRRGNQPTARETWT